MSRNQRTWAAALATIVAACGLAVGSSSLANGSEAEPAPPAQPIWCTATNVNEERVLKSRDGWALSTAIDVASPGDRIRVKGVCTGEFTVSKKLTITGGNAEKAPVLTSDPDQLVLLVAYDPETDSDGELSMENLDITGGATYFGEMSTTRMWKVRFHHSAGVTNGGQLKAWSTTFDNISDTTHGYAFFNYGSATLTRSKVHNNVDTNRGYGGGLFNEMDMRVVESSVRWNEPDDLSGLHTDVVCSWIGDQPPTDC